jgi:hypothetical protein
MFRWCVVLLLIVLGADGSFAQNANGPQSLLVSRDPYIRRANRDQVVAVLNMPEARAFVETPYGDQACAAVFKCSTSVGRKLVEFHASGDLDRLPKPGDLLRVIGLHGDDVANYVLRHPRELQDPDCMDAFLQRPVDISLELEKLEVAGSRYRASRLTVDTSFATRIEWGPIIAVTCVLILGVMVWYKRRKATSL